jgi:hypothetical protein
VLQLLSERFRAGEPRAWDSVVQAARERPFLSYLLHNVEFSVAAADPGIMAEYATQVGDGVRRTRGVPDALFGAGRQQRRPRLACFQAEECGPGTNRTTPCGAGPVP